MKLDQKSNTLNTYYINQEIKRMSRPKEKPKKLVTFTHFLFSLSTATKCNTEIKTITKCKKPKFIISLLSEAITTN